MAQTSPDLPASRLHPLRFQGPGDVPGPDGEGSQPRGRREDQRPEARAGLAARVPVARVPTTSSPDRCRTGDRPWTRSTSTPTPYYANPLAEGDTKKSWDDLPADIKNTFDKLGIPKAEREFFGGVGAQYDSGTVYHKIREDLAAKGVVFTDTDTAVKEYPDIVRKYFGKIVPYNDNKFSALNSAVWSGGSFVYIPPGVDAGIPLQAYFRINAKNVGQFERTLIIADKGAKIHYIEGCTAPVYSTDSLHAAVVEVVAEPYAKVRYTTVQNWSKNVYNLVTKRAVAYENSLVEWVDGNLGSQDDDEVPVRLPARPRGPRRHPVGGVRLRRADHRLRGEGGPLGAGHLEQDHRQVDRDPRRADQLPRASSTSPPGRPGSRRPSDATPSSRTRTAVRTPIRTTRSTKRMRRSPTRRSSGRSARSRSST